MARTKSSGSNAQPVERGERTAEQTLDAAMRAPSTTTPEVVVLDHVDEEREKLEENVDPKRDLFISTVDGRV